MMNMLYILVISSAAAYSRDKCVSSETCWPSAEQLHDLGNTIQGDVVLPGDRAWEASIKLKNPRLDIIPGAAVMVETSDDVISTMKFAILFNLELSIKSTGHCYSGNCMKNGSLHIDLKRMKNISLDLSNMALHVQPGINFDAMYKVCDDNGILVVGGMCPTVGPVGYSLGGGHGPLIRSYGLGADNILSMDIVTASGQLIHISPEANSKLFWALKGGGGGVFGIVVSMSLRVYLAPPQMVSLSCAWPLSENKKRVGEPVLAEWYGSLMTSMPDQWTWYTVAMKSPLGPKVPKWNAFTMDGLLILEGLYNGPYGQKMLTSVEGLLHLGKEQQLKCEFKNYTSFRQWHEQAWFADEGPIPFRNYMATSFAQPGFNRTTLAKIITDTILELPWNAVNMMFGVQLGGKISNPEFSTSVSPDFRSAVLMQENDADWNFQKNDANQIEWAQRVGNTIAAMKGFQGSYLNEPDPSKGRGVYEDLFWGNTTFTELQTIKEDWDPTEMFDCYQCVYNPIKDI